MTSEYRKAAQNDNVEDVFDSIEWDINDVLQDLDGISGINIIDTVRGKLETLARKVY